MLPTATETLTIVIADDHPLFREGVIAALAIDPGIRVLGEAENADAALHLVRQLRPDVVLLDLTMPGGGLQAVSRMSEAAPSTRVIMLTASDDEEHLLSAIQAGARGYVLKGIEADELVKIVRSVHGGAVYVAPSMAFGMLREMSRPTPPDPLDALAPREREVLQLLAGGLDNQEIAERLGLAEPTVKQYMSGILRKLGVGTRVEAAVLAARLGLGPDSAP